MSPQLAIDTLELWVGDLDRKRHQFTSSFGFQEVTPLNLAADNCAISLASGGVYIVVRQGTSESSPIARHVAEHGDTVADVGLRCSNVGELVELARDYGLAVLGPADRPTVDLLGDRTICHSLGPARSSPADAGSSVPQAVDHVAYCLPWGTADKVAQIYHDVFGMRRLESDSFDEIGGAEAGMRSIVMRSAGGFTAVLTEPASSAGSGQTQSFLDAHAGPGVQHVALRYDDLAAAVESLRSSGAEFLPIPGVYYERARTRVNNVLLPWETLQRLEILVDADHEGQLFQLFTRPIADRGTFFFELIQRAGATGFGVNNVRALFEAVQATLSEDS